MFDIGEVHRDSYSRLKRLIDVALAVVLLPVLLVAIPCVAVANLLGNRGPLFFRQQRVGKSGKVFTIWKFRTMRDAPAEHDLLDLRRRSPHHTRRAASCAPPTLDELPQLVNVLKGDLSIVGPRPEQPAYVAELVDKVPFYDLRHLVRPGMTGWRQVKFGYAGSEAEALEGLQFDFFYLRRQSLVFDLRIIGRTLRSVVRRQGR